jgi:protein-tyrosine phosphatase
MTDSRTEPLSIVDLHSHLVPGVDDGTASVAESLSALAGLYREGVRTLVTTPHLLLPRLDTDAAITRELELHRAAFETVVEASVDRGDVPVIALGQEIWAPDAATARRITRRRDLGLGGNYLLIEFGFNLQGTHVDVIREVQGAGRRILIAHPERYEYPAGHDPIELMQQWRELGALLQVNVGSLTGHYRRSNPGSDELAWKMVELGLIDILATDHHGPRRDGVSPREALEALIARGERALADRAMVENPGAIVRGEPVASGLPR